MKTDKFACLLEVTQVRLCGDIVYDLDEETGILSVSASPKTCKKLMEIFGITGDSGPKDVKLPVPGEIDTRCLFKNVTHIMSIPPQHESGEWYVSIEIDDGEVNI